MGRDHNGFRLAAASGVGRQPGVESRHALKIKQGLQLRQPPQPLQRLRRLATFPPSYGE